MAGADLDALVLLPPRPAWWADAACRVRPDVNFVPERGESAAPAKALCAECPVRAACLAFATEENIDVGVWGGLSGVDRRRARAGTVRRRSIRSQASASGRWRGSELDELAPPTAGWRRQAAAAGAKADRLSYFAIHGCLPGLVA